MPLKHSPTGADRQRFPILAKPPHTLDDPIDAGDGIGLLVQAIAQHRYTPGLDWWTADGTRDRVALVYANIAIRWLLRREAPLRDCTFAAAKRLAAAGFDAVVVAPRTVGNLRRAINSFAALLDNEEAA